MWSGNETTYTNTTMVTDTKYEIRVIGVNFIGNSSEPSESLCFYTLKRGEDPMNSIKSRSLDSNFTIDCTGDICVGDTILFTERYLTSLFNISI